MVGNRGTLARSVFAAVDVHYPERLALGPRW